MVILLIEKVIDNKMFPKSTAGLYISDSYQRNFISHRHRIFYSLKEAADRCSEILFILSIKSCFSSILSPIFVSISPQTIFSYTIS